MPAEKLRYTTYRNPFTPGPSGQPPLVRAGNVTYGEAVVDQEQYYQPLDRVHGSLHQWGVGAGFRVTAQIGSSEVRVGSGIGVDIDGRHVSLAENGNAEIDPNAAPGGPSQIAGVGPQGVLLSTKGMTGKHFVTVQFYELFNDQLHSSSTAFLMDHVPWLRIVDAGAFVQDGRELVLACVQLGEGVAGIITALTAEGRRAVGIPVQRVALRKPRATSGTPAVVEERAYGDIHPLRGLEGIEVTVPNPSDEIHFKSEERGLFRKLSAQAEQIVAVRGDGTETVIIDSDDASVIAGNTNEAGSVQARDAGNRLAVELDGAGAEVLAGTSGNTGNVRVRDGGGQDAVHLDGAQGDITYRGRLMDPAGSHNGVTHGELAQLTSGGFTGLHRHVNGAARPLRLAFPRVLSSGSATFNLVTVTFSSRFVFAYIALVSFDPTNFVLGGGELVFADIVTTSAGAPPVIATGGQFGPPGSFFNQRRPTVTGVLSSVTFRVVSAAATEATAVGVVIEDL